jgi:hypothetical protein
MVKKQSGGDGYVINVNEAIGGMPAFTRYSNNYRPIFDGELLQNGGGDCGCSSPSDDPSIFDLIQQQGGNKKISKTKIPKKKPNNELTKKTNKTLTKTPIKKTNKNKSNITQFHAIREVAYILTPLSLKALIILIVKLVLFTLSKIRPRKVIQFGGFTEQLQEIIAPLGKNNLLVLASLLLLHHFAVESKKITPVEIKKPKLKGGESFINSISEILAPLGVNSLGSSVLLIILQQAFTKNKISTNLKKMNQKGGNPLKNLIAPLGTNAFIATGLLIVIEKLFNDKIRQLKSDNKEKKILIGGKINKKFEKLFNMIAPITFNAFAKESFLKKMALNQKK